MRNSASILLVLGLIFIQIHSQDLRGLFDAWKLKHNKDYSTLEADAAKFEVFCQNYAKVQEWNSQDNTAVLGLNIFADLTSEEFKALHTSFFKPSNPGEIQYDEVTLEDPTVSYPSTWNWAAEGAVTPVQNMTECGACYAFTSVGAAEGLYKINGNPLTAFSPQQIIDCSTGTEGCDGGNPGPAIQYVAKYGLETLTDYPYTGNEGKCQYDQSLAINTTATGVGTVASRSAGALYTRLYQQPTTIALEADQSVFQLYTTGIITTGCGMNVDHCVLAVGYTENYFIMKNMWGTDWGQDGYVWISSSSQYNDGMGACGIFSLAEYPTGLNTDVSISA